jgi:hypothetical protein
LYSESAEVFIPGTGSGELLAAPLGAGVGLGAAFTATPLFQINFLPDFMQVNFLPATVEVAPALLHLAPALAGAATDVPVRSKLQASTIAKIPVDLRMDKSKHKGAQKYRLASN